MDRDQLIKMMDKQIEVEETAIKLYKETMDSINNFAIKLIFQQLLMDSTRHRNTFKEIKNALIELPFSDWTFAVDRWINREQAKRELERHIKLETGMITQLEEEIKLVDNKVLKRLLEHVLEDERRHHSTLKELIKQV